MTTPVSREYEIAGFFKDSKLQKVVVISDLDQYTVKTPTTICSAIFQSILRISRAYHADTYRVLASQSVIDQLLHDEAQRLAELEQLINKTIYLQVKPMYFCEQFDVVTH